LIQSRLLLLLSFHFSSSDPKYENILDLEVEAVSAQSILVF